MISIIPHLDGVFTVIKALFHDSQNLWSSEQILQAWGKTRSVKSNKNSDCHREKGNQNVKLENWTKGKQKYFFLKIKINIFSPNDKTILYLCIC